MKNFILFISLLVLCILILFGILWGYHTYWAEWYGFERPTTMEAFSNQFGLIGIFISFFAFVALIWTIILQYNQIKTNREYAEKALKKQDEEIKANKAASDRSFAALDEENFRNQVYQRLSEAHKYRDNCEFLSDDTKLKGINAVHEMISYFTKFRNIPVSQSLFLPFMLSEFVQEAQNRKSYFKTFYPWRLSTYRLMIDIYKKYEKDREKQKDLLNLVLDSFQKYEIDLLTWTYDRYSDDSTNASFIYNALSHVYLKEANPEDAKMMDASNELITNIFVKNKDIDAQVIEKYWGEYKDKYNKIDTKDDSKQSE